MRWLLLDQVVVIEKKKRACSRSRVPETGFSPELAMIEMMAQTGALLLGAESDFKEDLVFAKIEKAEFSGGLRAGDSLEIEAASDNLRPEGAWFEGIIRHRGRSAASARFLLMNVGHLAGGGPVTFHDAFMNYFKIREKIK